MIPSLPKLLGLIAIIWVVWTVFRIYETRQAAIRAQQTKDGDESRHDAPPINRLTCANVKSAGRGSVERIVSGKTAPIEVGSTCFSMAFVATLRRWF